MSMYKLDAESVFDHFKTEAYEYSSYCPVNPGKMRGEWHWKKTPNKGEVSGWADWHYNEHKAEYLILPYFSWGDYVGSSVERSNYECFIEMFKDEDGELPEGMYDIRGSFSSYGIAIHKDALKNEELLDLINFLMDYPVVNDEHYSKLKHELEEEAWGDYIKYDLESALEAEEIEYNEDTIKEDFHYTMEANNIYFVHGTGCVVYVDIDRIVDNWIPAGE